MRHASYLLRNAHDFSRVCIVFEVEEKVQIILIFSKTKLIFAPYVHTSRTDGICYLQRMHMNI